MKVTTKYGSDYTENSCDNVCNVRLVQKLTAHIISMLIMILV